MKHLPQILTLLLCVVFMLPLPAQAAYGCTLDELPVYVDCPRDTAFTVTLEPQDDASQPSQCTLRVTGGQGSFCGFAYDTPGNYCYRVRLTGAEDPNVQCDGTCYLVTVQVTRDETGRLQPSVYAVREQQPAEKTAALQFAALYLPPTTPTPAPTPTPVPTASPVPTPAPTAAPVLPVSIPVVRLAQTGQLNWPVPLLCGGGILLLAAAWRGKRRQNGKK